MINHTSKLLFLLLIALLFTARKSHATHQTGIEFSYECVGTQLYKIHGRAYYHCSSSSGINIQSISFSSASGPFCSQPSLVVGSEWLPQNIRTDATPVCPASVTNCQDPASSISGIWQAYNYATYDFSQTNNCAFYISWQNCCRNNAITSGAANDSWYTNLSLIDPQAATCNSSPQFNTPPVFQILQNDTTYFDQGAIDPDGDSLVYSIGGCLRADTTLVNYNPGYGPLTPLGPTWDISIHPVTGILRCIPTPGSAQIAPICILVEEYRNGVKIGQVWRDAYAFTSPQLNENPNIQFVNPTFPVTVSGDTIYTPGPGSPLYFDISSTDPDTGQQISLYWDQQIPGAIWSDASTLLPMDTVQGTAPTARFCWTPSQPGFYPLRVSADDSYCPFFGSTIQEYVIAVGNSGLIAGATPLSCLMYSFSPTLYGGTGPYSFAWSGQGGINTNPTNTDSSFYHTFPGPGTYQWSVTVTDPSGYNHTYSDSITISTANTANLLFAPQSLGCPPDSMILYAPAGYAQYAWSNGTTTQSTWLYQPGPISIVVTDSSGCTYTDTIEIQRTASVTIEGNIWYPGGPEITNTPVVMLAYNPVDSSFFPVDTAYTDSLSTYTFECPNPGQEYKFQMWPDRTIYPDIIPTYHGRWLVWQQANSYDWTNPSTVRITTILRTVAVGNGRVGGTIRKNGAPVEGLTVWAVNQNKRGLKRAITDSTGYFQFSSLPMETIHIWVDKPHVDNDLGPALSLTPGNELHDSLDFILHPTWLEVNGFVGRESELSAVTQAQVIPNPFSTHAQLSFSLRETAQVNLTLMDVQGKRLQELDLGALSQGPHTFPLPHWDLIPVGLYLVKIESNGQWEVMKVIKQ